MANKISNKKKQKYEILFKLNKKIEVNKTKYNNYKKCQLINFIDSCLNYKGIKLISKKVVQKNI